MKLLNLSGLRLTNAPRAILWAIYLSLLAVQLQHTSWAFSLFESERWLSLGWVAAIAFELAIAAFTWRLSQRIETTPRYTSGRVGWRKFQYRYLNVYAVALSVAIAVSSLANWAHAVEFGRPFAVFAEYSIPPALYSIAFGAILPACSLLFAYILADLTETDHRDDPNLTRAKDRVKTLNAQVSELTAELTASKQQLAHAEQVAQLVQDLTNGDKRQRIKAAADRWPALPQASIAVVTETSRGYVSEVLSSTNGHGEV